jgi:hypothetical protein
MSPRMIGFVRGLKSGGMSQRDIFDVPYDEH